MNNKTHTIIITVADDGRTVLQTQEELPNGTRVPIKVDLSRFGCAASSASQVVEQGATGAGSPIYVVIGGTLVLGGEIEKAARGARPPVARTGPIWDRMDVDRGDVGDQSSQTSKTNPPKL